MDRYWRRDLPHWTPEDAELFVTWRLADRSMPVLTRPAIASMLKEVLEYGASKRRSYDLLAWVIMPDHVHVVIRPAQALHEIMRWLKGATANRANRLLGRTGAPFWQREYYDRWMRSDEELNAAIAYIEDNPVRKGLASSPEEWR